MLHSMGYATVSARFHTSPTVLYLNTLKHTTIMSPIVYVKASIHMQTTSGLRSAGKPLSLKHD